MRILFDTSALAKRYKNEVGRDRVQALLHTATDVVLAVHTKVEIASSFCRELRDQAITQAQHAQAIDAIEADFTDFEVRPLNAEIEAYAIAVMQRIRLRAMDALHIGTAQQARVNLFVTADRKQAQAAQAVGLKTELVEAAL